VAEVEGSIMSMLIVYDHGYNYDDDDDDDGRS
jgi:hypothetical protein